MPKQILVIETSRLTEILLHSSAVTSTVVAYLYQNGWPATSRIVILTERRNLEFNINTSEVLFERPKVFF